MGLVVSSRLHILCAWSGWKGWCCKIEVVSEYHRVHGSLVGTQWVLWFYRGNPWLRGILKAAQIIQNHKDWLGVK